MVSLKQKKQSGFTIVELLIVIVIIGILAGLVITQVLGATAKARDTERKTDLDQIAAQLETYYSKTGGYPNSADLATQAWRTNNEMSMGDQNKSLYDPSVALTTALDATHTLNASTTDPTAIGGYYYIPGVNGTASTTCVSPTTGANPPVAGSGTFCNSFVLKAYLENTKDTSATNGVYKKTSAN